MKINNFFLTTIFAISIFLSNFEIKSSDLLKRTAIFAYEEPQEFAKGCVLTCCLFYVLYDFWIKPNKQINTQLALPTPAIIQIQCTNCKCNYDKIEKLKNCRHIVCADCLNRAIVCPICKNFL